MHEKRIWLLLVGALLMLSGCAATLEATVDRESRLQVAESRDRIQV